MREFLKYDYNKLENGKYVMTFGGVESTYILDDKQKAENLKNLLNDPDQKDWGFSGFDQFPEEEK